MKRQAARRAPLSISVSPELRRLIEDAAERNGQTLKAEVEGRLRWSLAHFTGDEIVTLKVDSGLMAWLRAYVQGCSFAGDLQASVVFILRQYMHDCIRSNDFFAMVPLLPEPIRSHVMKSPKWRDHANARGLA